MKQEIVYGEHNKITCPCHNIWNSNPSWGPLHSASRYHGDSILLLWIQVYLVQLNISYRIIIPTIRVCTHHICASRYILSQRKSDIEFIIKSLPSPLPQALHVTKHCTCKGKDTQKTQNFCMFCALFQNHHNCFEKVIWMHSVVIQIAWKTH